MLGSANGRENRLLGDHYRVEPAIQQNATVFVAKKRRRFRRPSAVTLVAWLFMLQFLLLLSSGTIFWPGGHVDLNALVLSDAYAAELLFKVVYVALGMLALIVAFGLLRLKRWAWLLAMTMEGLNLASALTAYAVGRPEYVTMLLGIIIVLSLNQEEGRQAFLPSEARRG